MTAKPKTILSGFEAFWELWKATTNRECPKKATRIAYERVVKRTTPQAINDRLLYRCLNDWAGRDPAYIPYAQKFLNSEDFGERTEAIEDDKELLPLFSVPPLLFSCPWCKGYTAEPDTACLDCVNAARARSGLPELT